MRKVDAGTKRAPGRSCRGRRAGAARNGALETPKLRRPPPRRGLFQNTSRAMANVGATTEVEAVRAEAAEIILADHDGDMEASLGRARDLALMHPSSVVAHRLLGELQYATAMLAAHSEGSSKDHLSMAALHLRVALKMLTTAWRLAPDCTTSALPSLSPPSSLLFPHLFLKIFFYFILKIYLNL
jgi:hypothetical protein